MKKKAFTLIELLAVIVILAIILGITIVSMTGVLKGAKSNSFESTQKALKIAAKTFISEHSDQCVLDTGEVYICTKDLIKDNYMNKITNVEGSNDECVGFVKVIRGNNGSNENYYTFKTYLDCNDKEYTDGLELEEYTTVKSYCETKSQSNYCPQESHMSLNIIMEINNSAGIFMNKVLTVTYPLGYIYQYRFDTDQPSNSWRTLENNIMQIEFKSNGTVFFRVVDELLNELSTSSYIVTNIDSTPIGTIVAYAGTVLPNGYLLADGSAISRATHADLFNKIGITYGSGNGSTTFNVPNPSGRVVVGQNTSDTSFDALGKTGGAKTHTLTEAEMPSHNHPPAGGTAFIVWGAPDANLYIGTGSMLIGGGSGASSGLRGGSQAHNNLQPYIIMNYIIKYR